MVSSLAPTPPHLSSPNLSRNASTSSARSVTTCSSTSSLQAAPMRPPPKETSTAATSKSQLPSRNQSESEGEPNSIRYNGPGLGVGGRAGYGRNGPRANILSLSPQQACVPPEVGVRPASPSSIRHNLTSRETNEEDTLGILPSTPVNPHLRSQQDATLSNGPRVTISVDSSNRLSDEHDPHDEKSYNFSQTERLTPTTHRGRSGRLTAPSSPTNSTRDLGRKARTLSVDTGSTRQTPMSRSSQSTERERRQSQVSTSSSVGKKPSINDWILKDELGQGSYSTVYLATPANPVISPTASKTKAVKMYAIKVINQAHLIQEKKVKYAMVERDALIRLSSPRDESGKGHKKSTSSSSSVGYTQAVRGKRKPNAVAPGHSSIPIHHSKKEHRDRLSIVTTSSTASSPVLTASSESAQLSPVDGRHSKALAGRRPSRSADPPQSVPEQTETFEAEDPQERYHFERKEDRSKPPSPVKEEFSEGHKHGKKEDVPFYDLALAVVPVVVPAVPPPLPSSIHDSNLSSTISGNSINDDRTSREHSRPQQSSKRRRHSFAPSEKSMKSYGGRTGAAHPGVIRLYSTFNDSTSLYFILSLASKGELAGYIRKYGSIDLGSTRYYSAQLLDTIEFMHSVGVIHRDLKPENILLDDNMRVKITDFGSAKIVDREEPEEEIKRRSFVGSADFVSPEVLRNEVVTPASDIWAFGCIVFQFITGKPPFRAATDYLTFQRILKLEMSFPEGFDEQAEELVNSCLKLDPMQRPSTSSLKSHAFFASIDFEAIWSSPAPEITTGLRGPPPRTSLHPSDIWGVFETSDGDIDEFEYDDKPSLSQTFGDSPQYPGQVAEHGHQPKSDHFAAATAATQHDNSTVSVIYAPNGIVDGDKSEDLRVRAHSEQVDPRVNQSDIPRPPYKAVWRWLGVILGRNGNSLRPKK
ncbi:hypothetical protein L204_100997 [Cryptococcus depauperatus]|nr:AGC/PDK1 protein kinase [Cryptococcus depauperatus CBS 7855]